MPAPADERCAVCDTPLDLLRCARCDVCKGTRLPGLCVHLVRAGVVDPRYGIVD